MLALEGIYQEGKLILKDPIHFNKPVKVIVTFLDSLESPESSTIIDINQFSFAKARALTKSLKTSLSDSLIEERRNDE